MKRNHHGGENHSDKIKYDFSVNINPFGLPPHVKEVLFSSNLPYEMYPDTECTKLCEKLSKKFGIHEEQIVCGNGASDLIYKICSVYQFKNAVIFGPAFSEYERALKQNNCNVQYILSNASHEFKITETQLNQLNLLIKNFSLTTASADKNTACENTAVFVCNPANPTGVLTEASVIKKIADICEKYNALLIIDECFMDFVSGEKSALHYIHDIMKKHVIILRAFTKIYAMAGLRLGYAFFPDKISAKMVKDFGPPWSVSGPAQAAGIAALDEIDYVRQSIAYISRQRMFITDKLKEIGLIVFCGEANYILFAAPAALGEAMAERGVAIRDCSNYRGLERFFTDKQVHRDTELFAYFRIAVRSEKENLFMLNAMAESLHKSKKHKAIPNFASSQILPYEKNTEE